jgi:hemoglobin
VSDGPPASDGSPPPGGGATGAGRPFAVRAVAKGPQTGGLDPAQVASMYERVGGADWFVALVDRFYAGVATDPTLRPLYPDDLIGPKAHLTGFLIQYWGGPMTYSEQRGHPRLRMRHARFAIGAVERDAWYRHMAAAVGGAGLAPEDESAFLRYFDMAATSLINQPG